MMSGWKVKLSLACMITGVFTTISVVVGGIAALLTASHALLYYTLICLALDVISILTLFLLIQKPKTIKK